MKLLQLYALSTGQKIDKPFLHASYYPIEGDYITVHASSGMESKNYSYWSDVVSIIKKHAPKTKIYQIGSYTKDSAGNRVYDTVVEGCEPLHMRDLNLHQTTYVLKNSKLHLSNDSFSVHVAGWLSIPTVCVYGPTTVANHSPYFHTDDSVYLESDRGGNKPTYSSREEPKTVNFVKPEKIASKALKILGCDATVKHETVYIGKRYPAQIFEYVPDATWLPDIPDGVLNVRMDYAFDTNNLVWILQQRTCKIVSSEPIDPRVLSPFKKKIQSIHFHLNDLITLEYLNDIRSLGVNIEVTTDEKDDKRLADKRLEFFDYMIGVRPVGQKPARDISGCRFKTRKFIFSMGEVYLSKAHWLNSTPAELGGVGDVIESQNFLDELEHFYIFKE